MDLDLPGQSDHQLVTEASSIAAATNGGVDPVPIIEAAIVAAEQERWNSFISVDADAVPDADRRTGPLAGVPIAIKDLINQAGKTTSAGSSFYRHEATESAVVVRRLEAAGATIIGRTGLHEFAFGFSSENPWFGPVRNPWDPSTSPGGSSGGSAAAVAAGIVPIAIGTDTGGSVRVPAAMCGIFGLKVTHGRIPISGVFPLAESLDTIGPLATSADDLALAYEVMAGFDAGDPWSVPESAAITRPMVSAGALTDWRSTTLGRNCADGI